MHIINLWTFICTHNQGQLIFNLYNMDNFIQLEIIFIIRILIILGHNNHLTNTIIIIFLLIQNLSAYQLTQIFNNKI